MIRRPLARRRTTRRPSRRTRQETSIAVWAVVAVAAVGLVAAVVNWLLVHWWLLLVLILLAVVGGIGSWQQRTQRMLWEQARPRALGYQLTQLDGLSHRQFEYAIRDLMQRDGCACRAGRRAGRSGRGREGNRPAGPALGDSVQASPARRAWRRGGHP